MTEIDKQNKGNSQQHKEVESGGNWGKQGGMAIPGTQGSQQLEGDALEEYLIKW